jgi:hypothetical protein
MRREAMLKGAKKITLTQTGDRFFVWIGIRPLRIRLTGIRDRGLSGAQDFFHDSKKLRR